MFDRDVPVYLITGFLESGKTTFLRDVLQGGDFYDGEPGLLILCEEGEVEYDEEALAKYNTVVEVIESREDFTESNSFSNGEHYRIISYTNRRAKIIIF